MTTTPDRMADLERDVRNLRGDLTVLQQRQLSVAAYTIAAVIVLGLVLPAWTEDSQRFSVLTTGFQALADDDGGDERGYFVVGFLGLLATVLVVLWVLLYQVAGRDGRARSIVRTPALALAVTGTFIAVILSGTAASSNDSDTSGGWGPVVLLAGLVAAVALINWRDGHKLWMVEESRPWPAATRRSATSSTDGGTNVRG